MAELTISGDTHPILKDDYASEWMGIEVLALDDGHATLRMTLRQEMLNGFGMAHGGMIFAFGDTAFALACNPANPQPGEPGRDRHHHRCLRRRHQLPEAGLPRPGAHRRRQPPRQHGPQRALRRPDLRRGPRRRRGTPQAPHQPPRLPHTAPRGRPADITPGELIAEFRGRSRTISKK